MKLISKIALFAGRSLCRYRGRPLMDRVEHWVTTFHRGLNNSDFDLQRNGEARVLDIISECQPKCFIDVGANVGEWSLMVNRRFPEAYIHAFEVLPSTFSKLTENINGLDSVKCHNLGLSEKEETLLIHHGADSVTASGCKLAGMDFHEKYYTSSTTCSFSTGAQIVEREGIERIDFLKIDVEGMDLKVIKGFESVLGSVRCIQFEYGIFNIASHDLLFDFCVYLKNRGFRVGKIFPSKVDFFDYHFDWENFHGSNYLAVREEETALIAHLAAQGRS